MKTFEAVFNENNKGVYGLSLVESPAMESDFIALSKDEKKTKIELKSVDEKKFILAGLVLEPNRPVYRYDEKTDEEFKAWTLTKDGDATEQTVFSPAQYRITYEEVDGNKNT